MNPEDPQPDDDLKRSLQGLRQVPARDVKSAARGKAAFLNQAALLRSTPARPGQRFPQPSGRRSFWSLLNSALLAVTLFFAGGAATVYAAQSSLPGQSLYPLKTLSEDALVALVPSPQAKIDLTLAFTDRRVAEMSSLQSQNQPIPGSLVERLNSESDQAVLAAAGLDSQNQGPALQNIRTQAAARAQSVSELLNHDPHDPALAAALDHSRQLANLEQEPAKDAPAHTTPRPSGTAFAEPTDQRGTPAAGDANLPGAVRGQAGSGNTNGQGHRPPAGALTEQPAPGSTSPPTAASAPSAEPSAGEMLTLTDTQAGSPWPMTVTPTPTPTLTPGAGTREPEKHPTRATP